MVEGKQRLSQKAIDAVERTALLNAYRHGGQAESGAVIGRIMAEFPELRSAPADVAKAVHEALGRVNGMRFQDLQALVRERYPEAEAPTRKEGRQGLPPLPNAVKGKTAFRLPPEPSGFMHIGHAMAFTINYLYSHQYDGELWLRFEDTNPKKVATRYYDSFREGIRWLGIDWDHEKNVSDDMGLIYDYGRKLVSEGNAYACSCDLAKVKRLRFDGTACEHRERSTEDNLRVWDELVAKKHGEGKWVVRFKGDMQNVNYSLRDPNIFRVIVKPHPLTGARYALWPTYDVANAIEDEICGITHILRSSEFRNELQQLIRDALRLRRPEVIQFSRFNFKGTPVQKRLLRPLVERKLVEGWGDPRMPTIEGLRRRGIIPEALREFTVQVGYTKSEHEYDWSILYAINRRLLDPVSRRLFFVPDPVSLRVTGAPNVDTTISFHPENDLGQRTIRTSGRFYVPKKDLEGMKKGTLFRLMDLYNVVLVSRGVQSTARYSGEKVIPDSKKVQWVTGSNVKTKILVPGLLFGDDSKFNRGSLRVVRGVAEAALSDVKPGEIVQFPRFGFCRLDAPGTLVFAH